MNIYKTMKMVLVGVLILLVVCAIAAVAIYTLNENTKYSAIRNDCTERSAEYTADAYIQNPELVGYVERWNVGFEKWKKECVAYGGSIRDGRCWSIRTIGGSVFRFHEQRPPEQVLKHGAEKVFSKRKYNQCIAEYEMLEKLFAN